MGNGNDIMEYDNKIISETNFIPWNELKNTTIFITGATGLIGSAVIRALNFANKKRNLGLKVIALVRDEVKANKRFWDILPDGMLEFVIGNVENLPAICANIDYMIHGASQTASKAFVEQAVETIQTSVLGTLNILNLAKEKGVKKVVYLSSMEVYGYPERGHKVKEEEIGAFTPLSLRNSYPISKIMSESSCFSYAEEYHVPAVICRMTQTFGPGVDYNDNRVFAYFGRCVAEKKNIVLKTAGRTERSYLYTADAVTAILLVMTKGTSGCVYNVANEDTYCSIADMAKKVSCGSGIEVEFDLQDEMANGFPQTLYMDLDTTAIRELGWIPYSEWGEITEMFRRMIASMKKRLK